jgi:uncharacterized RDD family membrane protein YckC
MPCPLCGEICRCFSEESSAASPRWLPDAEVRPADAKLEAGLETPAASEPSPPAAAETALPNAGNQDAPEDSAAWRLEVAARLNRYHSRRKPRPPRYPSLRLRFEGDDATRTTSGAPESSASPQMLGPACDHALALDGFSDSAAHALETPAFESHTLPAPQETANFASAGEIQHAAPVPTTAPATAPTTAKILEFPRSWTPPLPPLDELAEPVFDRERPRILEAPEVVPPPPALGGITIEPTQQPEMEKRPGIDIPLQSAPLARRVLSAVIDGIVIATACALFGLIFWKVAAFSLPRLQIVGFLAGLAVVFWAAYQYLLVVYAGTTPGLRLSRLELARFDGSPARRRLRRWRVLASFLSAVSLGMGYAWVFLDEDSLCWHDRITHTYLAPKVPNGST